MNKSSVPPSSNQSLSLQHSSRMSFAREVAAQEPLFWDDTMKWVTKEQSDSLRQRRQNQCYLTGKISSSYGISMTRYWEKYHRGHGKANYTVYNSKVLIYEACKVGKKNAFLVLIMMEAGPEAGLTLQTNIKYTQKSWIFMIMYFIDT